MTENEPATIGDLPTPALVIDRPTFNANRAAMDALLPGDKLRPHVKAFKTTALAQLLADDGHRGCDDDGKRVAIVVGHGSIRVGFPR